ncbi:sensor histidine kinase [Larkinella arboricola]|uniref:sensor histidine kinase n=1 Tax=Larkinella arboricola TaxID=643671 RepID=UPI001474261C|nr:HAMP domain-containing sensor histidine kinase [Larkinella arboricola]
MFNRIILAGLLFIIGSNAYAQNTLSLLTQLQNARHDSTRLQLYAQLADTLYAREQFDSLYSLTKQALRLAQRCVADAKSIKVAKDIAMGLETLALVQERMGYYQQALKSYKEYQVITDSLRTVEKSAKVQALYELEKKESTIQLLQKKSQLDYLKVKQQEQKLALANRQRPLYIMGISVLTSLVGITGYFLRRFYRAQQLLTRKKQEIETQARELQETNRLKDRLFAIVGHDLRSPVASLKASFTLLKIKDRYPTELTRLEQEVNGLSQTLDTILYWSLNQQQGLQLRQQRLLLQELIQDALDGFTGFIRQKQLIVTFNAVPACVWADENMTMLVFRNILHNAFKFTPPGGAVRISIAIEPDQTSLRIADTGIGMDVTYADADRQAQQGTGIGLSLSKDLMQRNGGRLTLESKKGRGTSVTLSWPNAKEDE